MNSDRLRLYIIEFSLILVLLLALIFNEYITRTIIMTVLLVFMVIAIKFIKGQKTETIYKKQMILLVSTDCYNLCSNFIYARNKIGLL